MMIISIKSPITTPMTVADPKLDQFAGTGTRFEGARLHDMAIMQSSRHLIGYDHALFGPSSTSSKTMHTITRFLCANPDRCYFSV